MVDATLSTSLSGELNSPIIYTKTNQLVNSVKEYIIQNKDIKTIYIIGGVLTDEVINEVKLLGRNVEIISGKDRYETNAKIIEKTHKTFNKVILVNNQVDAIFASKLANKTNSVMIYTTDATSSAHINLINKNQKISNVYYLGGSSIKVGLRDFLYYVRKSNMSKCKNPTEELLFMNKKAVFYIPHQDDETSFFGQLITAAIDKLGTENVYLVEFTDGAASAVNKQGLVSDLLSKYQITFTQARDREFVSAIKELGVTNYKFVEELDFIDKRFQDSDLGNNAVKVKEIMKYYDNLFKSDVTHFTYTFHDPHIDHNTLGKSLNELYYDTALNDKQFENVFFVTKITENYNIPNKHVIKYKNSKNYQKQLNAFKKYDEDLENGLIGIGYISSPNVFNFFVDKIKNDTLESVIHIPYKN